MSRQPIVVANWKMNKLPSEAEGYIQEVAPKLAKYPNVDAVLAGQDVLLNAMVSAAKGTSVWIGAENVYWEDRGAYTGETSPAALADLGIQVSLLATQSGGIISVKLMKWLIWKRWPRYGMA